MSTSSGKRAQRKARQEEKRRRQMIYRGLIALVIVAVLGGIAYFVWSSAQPPLGSADWIAIPTQEGIHIETGATYEPYNSDPPTSGAHYGDPPQPAPAGFYDTAMPDENMVHSLEHGYVIIWYDCTQVSEDECTSIKEGLQNVITATNTFKVVAMPREGMDAPIIATSWGMMYTQETLDTDRLIAFVKANRNKAPEPMAD